MKKALCLLLLCPFFFAACSSDDDDDSVTDDISLNGTKWECLDQQTSYYLIFSTIVFEKSTFTQIDYSEYRDGRDTVVFWGTYTYENNIVNLTYEYTFDEELEKTAKRYGNKLLVSGHWQKLKTYERVK